MKGSGLSLCKNMTALFINKEYIWNNGTKPPLNLAINILRLVLGGLLIEVSGVHI